MLFLLVSFVVVLVYYYLTRNFDYWAKRGVKHDNPIPLFGNNFRQFFFKISLTDIVAEQYFKYPEEKMVGFYRANEPRLILRDPELVKQVLITDFPYFYRRGLNPHKEVIEPLLKNLFFADGDIWKLLRQRMTPAFTSGKLKAMFPLIVERAEKLQQIAADAARTGKEVDVRDLMARYTTDFIGACGFGIEADALNDEDSTFRKLGKRIFTTSRRDGFVVFLKLVFPETFKNLNFLVPEIEQNAVGLVKSIMEQRNYKPIGRNDFIDLLLELREKGKIVGESIEKRKSDGTPLTAELEFDDLLMTAQVFIFFAAGFETSSSATSYTLNQIAFHPDVQKKCQDEIDTVLAKYDNKLCYEAVKEMQYLDMAFKEGMRMFPSLGFLIRRCAKQYTFPGTNITIDEGIPIMIPLQAMQTDEKYFEDPELFLPERFHPDRSADIKKHIYLPFGEGPRACIGERLGHMQSLAGIAALLHKYSVTPSPNSLKTPLHDPRSTVVQSIKGGIPLCLVARKKNL
ncbi:cytochrome P450 6B2 [Plutella xylostella]|uniref:cytochrome P450 6B2 n=1 Tax=Plutella xylostella TaxID=51655 RepID=UPI002032F985|nr:cytochrome P450 6B2 [Plutella xylostella]